MFEDNQIYIKLLSKYEHKRLKHVDIKFNFIKDLVEDGIMIVEYVPTGDQIADVMTKGLPSEKFVKLRNQLGMSQPL